MNDVPTIYCWVNDPELRPYLNRSFPVHISEEEDWIKDLPKRKEHHQVWMIVVDGIPIGTMGLHNINWQNRTATTGAMFGNKAYQNCGIGQQVKMMLLKHAFDRLNLRQIYSEVIGFNARSRAYSEKCGYHLIATLPDDIHYEGRFFDKLILRVRREDWLPLWERFREVHNIESLEEMLLRHRSKPVES
ncbi:MAG TPA: GNAT family protein [Candidatus Paceibacterota bacterium]|nr:GNAT family protein [Candidatus Paceibacterota bacterium]